MYKLYKYMYEVYYVTCITASLQYARLYCAVDNMAKAVE